MQMKIGLTRRKLFVSLAITSLFVAFFIIAITVFEDPVSSRARRTTEAAINGYIESVMDRAERGDLTLLDRGILHVGLLAGTILSRFHYPEASMMLHHYVHGDGATLELPGQYFSKSVYLNNQISSLGDGDHGPLALRQEQDWRLSLAFNPFYLSVRDGGVRLYHPKIAFAPVGSARAVTIVPIGKLRLQIYDNLVSALDPTPFEAFATWRQP